MSSYKTCISATFCPLSQDFSRYNSNRTIVKCYDIECDNENEAESWTKIKTCEFLNSEFNDRISTPIDFDNFICVKNKIEK